MLETEISLLRRFANKGDSEAFSEIVRQHAGLVYGACLRVLEDKTRAADVVQETFFQLYKDAGRITGSVPSWLHRVATRKAIDVVRKDSRRRRREAKYAADRLREAESWEDISGYIDEGLDDLDDETRQILIHRFFEGRSMADIAGEMDISQPTVSRRVESGVSKLRETLRKRGIMVAAAALVSLLAENAVEAAPVLVMKELGKIALLGTTAAVSSGAKTAATGVLTGVKAKIITATAAAAIGTVGVVAYKDITRPAKESAPPVVREVEQPEPPGPTESSKEPSSPEVVRIEREPPKVAVDAGDPENGESVTRSDSANAGSDEDILAGAGPVGRSGGYGGGYGAHVRKAEPEGEQEPSGFRQVEKSGPVNPSNQNRTLHFLTDRSVGMVWVQDEDTKRKIKTFYYWDNSTQETTKFVGEAKYNVQIPPAKRVLLYVNPQACQDLSWLSNLKPNDICKLYVYGDFQGGPKPDDSCMPHLARLTGLKALQLVNTDIGNKGMKYITSLQSLQRLTMEGKMSDKTMKYVAQLKSLKGLYLKETNVTNKGLRELKNLTYLEELELGGKYIDDIGLAHLKKLPKLNYLLLWGDGFTDKGLVHLSKLPSLKVINLYHTPKVSDEGLKYLSQIEPLENLNVAESENITDKGLSYLSKMPTLRKLDISSANITDKGLASLSQIKTLEYLEPPKECVTDENIDYLTRLTKLKHLGLPIPCYVRNEYYKKYYTEEGLKKLVKLENLEELFIAGIGVTDTAIDHIAKLKKLKKLTLFGCPVTKKGLSGLAGLKNLRDLWLYQLNITTSDLSQLNPLIHLKKLRVQQIEHGDNALDVSGLTELEKLSITLRKKQVLTDKDLNCLTNLKKLKWLQIYPHKFTDSGVAKLAGLTNMERLGIGGPNMTEEALSYLSNMKKLNHLTISDGDITDKGIKHLENLKALRYLNITSNRDISPGALDRLRNKIPCLTTLRVNKNWEMQKTPRVGQKAPDFKFTTMDGKTIELADFKDKVLLLYFWATWCRPCIASTPALKRFYRDMSRYKDFEMISLSMDGNEQLVREHIKKYDLTWPQVRIGLHSRISSDYGVNDTAPKFFLIGPDGKILLTPESPQVDTKSFIEKVLKNKKT